MPADTRSARTDFDSLEQAADWFARLRDDGVTEADRAAWRGWLARHAEHRVAWAHIEAVGRRFSPLQAPAEAQAASSALASLRNRSRLSRRQMLGSLGLAFGGGLLAYGLARHTPMLALARSSVADHRTTTGETREIALTDHTRVWLGSASTLNVDYSTSLRRLQLLRGEVLVDTARDTLQRPLVVDNAQGRMRALGTRFSVRQDEAQTRLAVFEGAVEIRSEQGAMGIVEAGQQVRFDESLIEAAESTEARFESWTRGLLSAENLPLGELITELSRHRRGVLRADPAVASLRVVGTYPLHDTDRALALLQAVLPIRIHRPLPWWTTVTARDAVPQP